MDPHFRLFWLRECGCDAGTVIRADQLEPEIRDQVVALAEGAGGEIALRLPFLDAHEWRRRGEVLRALQLERRGDTIAPVLAPAAALRDAAANSALADPAWASSPPDTDQRYFPVWQSVSVTLQRALRDWIPKRYFQSLSQYADRDVAYPMVVYQVTRLFYGRPRTEFTYDLRDYPDCALTLASAWKMIGRSLQTEMAQIEQRLHAAGMQALARRYAPVWHHDVMAALRKKPKQFVELLAAESTFINAVIDLGSDRSAAGVNRFARTANQALRNVHGMDVRRLGVRALEEATGALRVASSSDGAPPR